MARTLIIGGTGRLGRAVTQCLHQRGDEVFSYGRDFSSLPDRINYVIFCQRYRGDETDICGEFDASVVLTAKVLHKLRFSDSGDCAAVIVSSVYAISPGPGPNIGYQLGKAAALALMRYEAATLGVRCNAVSPWAFTGKHPALTMEEVVNVIEFLASPKSSGINQQNIVIDKGKRAGMH